jgi:hypothetical protein
MIEPSQCVFRRQGPELKGVGEIGCALTGLTGHEPGTVGFWPSTQEMSWGLPDCRFFQSASRTPLHSTHGSPSPPQTPPRGLSR